MHFTKNTLLVISTLLISSYNYAYTPSMHTPLQNYALHKNVHSSHKQTSNSNKNSLLDQLVRQQKNRKTDQYDVISPLETVIYKESKVAPKNPLNITTNHVFSVK